MKIEGMKRDFKDKVIAITGASGNLGRAICERFATAGAKVVALDYNQKALGELEQELKKQNIEILPVLCDITDKKACYTVSQKIVEKFGRIDGLVNNAGTTHIERFTNMDKEKDITRRVMEVNFFGAVNCAEAMLEQIRKNKGVIVNISSVAGFAPLLGRTAYCASKHALHGFFETLGTELEEDGVHCLMVCPSFIAPPSKIAADNDFYQDKKTIGQAVSTADIADNIHKACIKGKKILIMGRTGKLSYFVRRFAPSFYEKKMIKKLKNEL